MLAPLLFAASLAAQVATEGLPRLADLAGHGSTAFEPFAFVHIGDPQIGYGSTWPAARRFERLAVELQSEHAAFGIVVGDLVQDRTWLENRLLRGALRDFALPLTFVPGNHDVVDAPTLAGYRADFGPDYHAFVFRGCGFIGLDSELGEGEHFAAEDAAQREWLASELARFAELELRHVFVFLHRPPFRSPGGDSDQDPLVRALREAGVRHVLAGHLHTTREIEARDAAFTVYTVGGTARVHDERGYGYRVFDVGAEGVRQRYVEFDRPSDHWLVRYGWSPRIVDPSLPHWLLTIVFLFTASRCWRAHRARDPDEEGGVPWRLFALAYTLLALNLQLDFDEILAAVGRSTVYGLGIAGERRFLQAALLGAAALVLGLALLLGWRRLRTADRRGLLAGLGLCLPLASFLLHTLSLHQTEVLLYVLGRHGLYFVEGTGAGLSAWMASRSAVARARS